MNMEKAVSSCLLMLSLVIVASARHLQPSSEDLMADMLVLVNTSKTERHLDTRSAEEGSGYGDIIPIQPLNSITMERMVQAPALESSNKEPMEAEHEEYEKVIATSFEDEGSGDNEKGIEDLYKTAISNEEKSDHFEEPITDITNSEFPEIIYAPVETNDSMQIEKVKDAELFAVENRDTKSEKMISMVQKGDENVVEENKAVNEGFEVKSHEEKDNADPGTIAEINLEPSVSSMEEEHTTVPSENKETVDEEVATTTPDLVLPEEHPIVIDEVSTVITPQEDSEGSASISIVEQSSSDAPPTVQTLEESSTDSFIVPAKEVIIEKSSTEIPLEIPSTLETTSQEVIIDKSSTEILSEIPSTTPQTILLGITSEEVIIEKSSTEVPSEIPSTTPQTILLGTTSQEPIFNEAVTEISTDEAIIISSTPDPILISSTAAASPADELTESTVNNREDEIVDVSTSADPSIDDVVTVSSSFEPSHENGTVMLKASLQIPQGESNEMVNNFKTVQESSIYKSLSLYVIAGILAIILIVLVIAFTMRYRRRSHRMRTDNRSEKDTENGLLSNGKYQEDSDENNIKNNEITPLVIKNSSQINKFEKSPNFSSQKNINTAVNDKNIEKDNVLKSNQTIIEDEDDTKKCIEDEVDEQKKKSCEDAKPLTAEKVVVHTRVDLDSIPKKPIIVNRNGHSYHAVPGGETET